MQEIDALLKKEVAAHKTPSLQYLFFDSQQGMCLSWFTGMLNGTRYFTHAGGGGGYYCEIRLYPEAQAGSAIFFNRTGLSGERFLDKVGTFYI